MRYRLTWNPRPKRRKVLGGDARLTIWTSACGRYEVVSSVITLQSRFPPWWNTYFNNAPLGEHRSKRSAFKACDRHAAGQPVVQTKQTRAVARNKAARRAKRQASKQ